MLRIAKFLLLITILYNFVEGVVALWAGISAGSIALVAFGADSYIEVAAASLVFWRLGIEDSEYTEVVEQRIVRQRGPYVEPTSSGGVSGSRSGRQRWKDWASVVQRRRLPLKHCKRKRSTSLIASIAM